MARTCSICTSPRRSQIDLELTGGDAVAAIARRYRVGRDALRRHRDAHLSPAMLKVSMQRYGEESATVALESIVPQLESLIARLEALMGVAEDRKSLIGASNLAREIRQSLELIGRLRGELQDRPTTVVLNVLSDPEFSRAVAIIAQELSTVAPEVRERIGDRLAALSNTIDAEAVS